MKAWKFIQQQTRVSTETSMNVLVLLSPLEKLRLHSDKNIAVTLSAAQTQTLIGLSCWITPVNTAHATSWTLSLQLSPSTHLAPAFTESPLVHPASTSKLQRNNI